MSGFSDRFSFLSRRPPKPSVPDPALAARYCKEGWDHQRKQEWRDALCKFDRAERLDPDDSGPAYGSGVTYCIMGELNKAIAALDRALAKGADKPAATRAPMFSERGLAHMQLDMAAEALDDFNQAVLADPTFPLTYLNRGQLMLCLRELDQAFADLARGVRMCTDTRFLMALGQCCAQRGEHDLALWCFSSYLRYTKKDHLFPQYVERAKRGIAEAQAFGATEAPWSHQALCWSELALLSPTDTVATLIASVHERRAFFILIKKAGGWQGAPLFGQNGVMDRLNELADLGGPSVLALHLTELQDVFFPLACISAAVSVEEAESAALSPWVLVQDGAQLRGVTLLPKERQQAEPAIVGTIFRMTTSDTNPVSPPTAVFEQPVAFRRQAEARTCVRCTARFAYYKSVVQGGVLSDFCCPMCGESALIGWLEERMRPGAWSTEGFLLPGASLEEVRRADALALKAAGSSAVELGAALLELLTEASAWYEADPARYEYGSVEIVSQLELGEWPAEELGFQRGPLQVFLTVYRGYQHCPFTALLRPFCSEQPGMPTRISFHNDTMVVETVPGEALPCSADRSYRFSDRDFVIINRESRTWLKGPGLIAHLLHDHGFCEDPRSPYRVDPTHALQVLQSSLLVCVDKSR